MQQFYCITYWSKDYYIVVAHHITCCGRTETTARCSRYYVLLNGLLKSAADTRNIGDYCIMQHKALSEVGSI